MRILALTIDRHSARDTPTPRVGTGKRYSTKMCYINLQNVYDSVDGGAPVGSTCPLRSSAVDDQAIRSFHDGVRARMPLDGNVSEWFYVRQELRGKWSSFPSLFIISGTALVVDVVIQHFAADRTVVSDVVHLDGAPKSEDGNPIRETPLARVRRAIWGVPYTDDAGMAPRSPDGMATWDNGCDSGGLPVVRTNIIGEKGRFHSPVVHTQLPRDRTVYQGCRPTMDGYN